MNCWQNNHAAFPPPHGIAFLFGMPVVKVLPHTTRGVSVLFEPDRDRGLVWIPGPEMAAVVPEPEGLQTACWAYIRSH